VPGRPKRPGTFFLFFEVFMDKKGNGQQVENKYTSATSEVKSHPRFFCFQYIINDYGGQNRQDA
jgi:hypothetical protein